MCYYCSCTNYCVFANLNRAKYNRISANTTVFSQYGTPITLESDARCDMMLYKNIFFNNCIGMNYYTSSIMTKSNFSPHNSCLPGNITMIEYPK